MDILFRACAALGASRHALFLTAFATLLARLAAQEAVTLRNSGGDATILAIAFDPEASFREAVERDPKCTRFRSRSALRVGVCLHLFAGIFRRHS